MLTCRLKNAKSANHGAFLAECLPVWQFTAQRCYKKRHDEKGVVERQVKYCCAQFMPDLDLQYKIPNKTRFKFVSMQAAVVLVFG